MKWIRSDFRNTANYIETAARQGLKTPGIYSSKDLPFIAYLADRMLGGGPIGELEFALRIWGICEIAELSARPIKAGNYLFRKKVLKSL
jgi:hypothetical protein